MNDDTKTSPSSRLGSHVESMGGDGARATGRLPYERPVLRRRAVHKVTLISGSGNTAATGGVIAV